MLNEEAIKKTIEEEVSPRLSLDGGGCELSKIDNNNVHVKLTGACGGCMYSTMTLQTIVEEILKSRYPEIENIINDTNA